MPAGDSTGVRNSRTRWLIAGVVGVVVVLAVAALAIVLRDKDATTPTDVTLAGPSATGSTYSVDFSDGTAAQQLSGLRRFTSGRLSSPAAVLDNRLTQGVARTTAATYFERTTTRVCESIGVAGAMAVDSPGTSALVLLLTDGPIPRDATKSPRPNVLAHLTITASGWDLGVWPAASQRLESVRSTVGNRSRADAQVAYEVRWEADAVTVIDSTGASTVVRDPRFGVSRPNYTTWELYQEGVGAASPSVTSWWSRCARTP